MQRVGGSIPSTPTIAILTPGFLIRDIFLNQLKSRSITINSSKRLLSATNYYATADNKLLVTGPFMGAPFAVAILEELVKRGIREFILVSIAGGLGDSFQVGDYILPTTAISDEGTSANYLQDTGSTSHAMPAQPSQNILNQFILSAKIESNSAFGIHRTTIASTDAPYREIPEKIYNLMRRGARTIDMEYSALLSAANFHKVSLQAVFAVSDVAAESGFASRKLKQALTQISSAVIDFCRDSVFENENTPLHRP